MQKETDLDSNVDTIEMAKHKPNDGIIVLWLNFLCVHV